MLVAGIDVGSLTGKAVLLNSSGVVSYSIVRSSPRPEKTAREAFEEALSKAGIGVDEVKYIIGTGYGRLRIPFADRCISEITCHAKGAFYLLPSVRTVIDVGGQDSKAIKVDPEGRVIDFIMNEKCAAGTGRFLEIMAQALEVSVEELGPLSLKARRPAKITSQCSVFAETEVIGLIAEGWDIADIAAGVNDSIAGRIASLVYKVGVERDVMVTGGIAKNEGFIRMLERKLGVEVKRPPIDPQVVGALGAAVIALEEVK